MSTKNKDLSFLLVDPPHRIWDILKAWVPSPGCLQLAAYLLDYFDVDFMDCTLNKRPWHDLERKLREAKPSERLVQTALGRLEEREGIKPSEVLYVGNDMLNDILPADRAGCRTALSAGDGRSFRLREGEPRVAGINPDLVVTDLLQLVKALV